MLVGQHATGIALPAPRACAFLERYQESARTNVAKRLHPERVRPSGFLRPTVLLAVIL